MLRFARSASCATTFVFAGALASTLLVPHVAQAASPDALASKAENELRSISTEAGAVQAAIERARTKKQTVEQRLTSGELLFRTKDYARAIVAFSEILEEFPDTPSYVDALYMRGEAFYGDHEYLSARRDYRAILDRGSEPRFQPYVSKALARLVDVCLRLNDLAGLDEVFAKLSLVPPSEVDAPLQYAKGKAYFFRKDYTSASSALAAVPNMSAYAHQARYFEGLVATRLSGGAAEGAGPKPTYKAAIDAFRRAVALSPDSSEHKHVIDLSWLAIARLHYEAENYPQAAEAYAKVGRESPEFGTMLYELGWVYVRLGDMPRAERALEILQISDPAATGAAEASLLRGDLLLRSGSRGFQKAYQLYRGVREEFEPMRAKVEAFLGKTSDPAVYYETLQQQLDILEQRDELPRAAVRWAREADDGPMAFAVIDDVNQCKQLIRQSYLLIDKLNLILGATNRIKAFPELLAGEEKALSLVNRIAHLRLSIAKGLDTEEPGSLSGAAGEARKERRALEAHMANLPVDAAGFAGRDHQSLRQWNLASQELTRRGVELDYLQATINGLRRMLRDDAQQGAARNPTAVKRVTEELNESERELRNRREAVAKLRAELEAGRAQVGFGDSLYQADALARVKYRDALDREVDLAFQGQAGAEARRYAATFRAMLQSMRDIEAQLVAQFGELEQQVVVKLRDVQAMVENERLKINGYNMQLGALDHEAKGVVGEVAKRNFLFVRDKLRAIVLRADVGLTEHAWEVREDELERTRKLQSERAREEQLLDEELREVMDDVGGQGSKK